MTVKCIGRYMCHPYLITACQWIFSAFPFFTTVFWYFHQCVQDRTCQNTNQYSGHTFKQYLIHFWNLCFWLHSRQHYQLFGKSLSKLIYIIFYDNILHKRSQWNFGHHHERPTNKSTATVNNSISSSWHLRHHFWGGKNVQTSNESFSGFAPSEVKKMWIESQRYRCCCW